MRASPTYWRCLLCVFMTGCSSEPVNGHFQCVPPERTAMPGDRITLRINSSESSEGENSSVNRASYTWDVKSPCKASLSEKNKIETELIVPSDPQGCTGEEYITAACTVMIAGKVHSTPTCTVHIRLSTPPTPPTPSPSPPEPQKCLTSPLKKQEGDNIIVPNQVEQCRIVPPNATSDEVRVKQTEDGSFDIAIRRSENKGGFMGICWQLSEEKKLQQNDVIHVSLEAAGDGFYRLGFAPKESTEENHLWITERISGKRTPSLPFTKLGKVRSALGTICIGTNGSDKDRKENRFLVQDITIKSVKRETPPSTNMTRQQFIQRCKGGKENGPLVNFSDACKAEEKRKADEAKKKFDENAPGAHVVKG